MSATPWKVCVRKPKPGRREKALYLRARRRVGTRLEERAMSASTTSWDRAAELAAIWERELNCGGSTLFDPDPLLLDLLDARIEHLKKNPKRRENTVKNCAFARLALAPHIGLLRASDVSSRTLRRVRSALQERADGKRRSNSTVNLYMEILRGAWVWAEQAGHVEGEWPRLKRLPVVRTHKRPFTDHEVAGILDWFQAKRPRWYPLMLLMAATGARGPSEIMRLREHDLDRQHNAVSFTETKTGVPRTIPLAGEVTKAIPAAPTSDGLLFSGDKPGRPVRPETIRYALKDALAGLRIRDPERLDLHSFRRAAVATLKRHIADTLGMQITGHADPVVYHNYQRNALGDDLRGAARILFETRDRLRKQNRGGGPSAASPAASPEPGGSGESYPTQSPPAEGTARDDYDLTS